MAPIEYGQRHDTTHLVRARCFERHLTAMRANHAASKRQTQTEAWDVRRTVRALKRFKEPLVLSGKSSLVRDSKATRVR